MISILSPREPDTDGPDLDGLEEFAKRGDRRSARFFVGRDDLIDLVEDVFRRAMKEVKDGGTAPTAVKIRPAHLEDPAEVAGRVAEAVSPGSSGEWRTERFWEVSAEARAFGSGGGRKGGSVPPATATLDALRERLPRKWKRPVCLMVDEIQGVCSEAEQKVRPKAADTLLAFHDEALGLPIVPLYAGLGDSQSMLEEANLTRLTTGNVRGVGALAGEEAEKAVDRMLDGFRVSRRHARPGEGAACGGREARDAVLGYAAWSPGVRKRAVGGFPARPGGKDHRQVLQPCLADVNDAVPYASVVESGERPHRTAIHVVERLPEVDPAGVQPAPRWLPLCHRPGTKSRNHCQAPVAKLPASARTG